MGFVEKKCLFFLSFILFPYPYIYIQEECFKFLPIDDVDRHDSWEAISQKGDISMKKFKIPTIPRTESKTIRMPIDLISEVESAIKGTNCTFSAFVVEAVRVALENLKEDECEKL